MNNKKRVGSLVVEFPIFKDDNGQYYTNMSKELTENFYQYEFTEYDLDSNKTATNIQYRDAKIPAPKQVIFNPPATIVFWDDDSKTVVKCQDMMIDLPVKGGIGNLTLGDSTVGTEIFDKEKGLAMAFCKKMFGNKGGYYNMFKDWCK